VTLKNRKLIPPTPEEDAAINRGIAGDPDTYEPSAREIAELKPLGATRRMGRPLGRKTRKNRLAFATTLTCSKRSARPAKAGRRA
jgi:hypothetical protein